MPRRSISASRRPARSSLSSIATDVFARPLPAGRSDIAPSGTGFPDPAPIFQKPGLAPGFFAFRANHCLSYY
ncbi:hypothetical protein BOSE21B_50122 [Bosea sp. 21B]|nr:hypothetical protein BOSE21B_50122 [Bosea sp. 21B]